MGKTNGLPSKVIQSPRRVVKTIVLEIICHDEEAMIEGNCSAIDPKTDRQQEQWIRKQLDGGNPWAWCRVEVKATMDDKEGGDYLGCCSYLSGDDFCRPGYFPDMVGEAVADLLNKLYPA